MIVGSQQARYCGVKNYSERLADALHEAGIHTEVLAAKSWALADVIKLYKQLKSKRFDIIHIQYPSIGFRGSLVPHLLGLSGAAKKTLVTIHEVSPLPRTQQLSTRIFSWTTHEILFVSQFEMDCYRSIIGRSRPFRLIRIGSNIPTFTEGLERDKTVLYFGQIRPQKGLEDFLSLARLSTTKTLPFNFVVAGSAPDKHVTYLEELRLEHPSVNWKLDLTPLEVSRLMAQSFAAYLPFPDGAGERRGTLLASLANGLPVISKRGPGSRPLEDIFLSADSPTAAVSHLAELNSQPDWAATMRERGQVFARKFEWSEIALEHKKLYESLLQTNS